jgi:hypothetical protein
MASSQRQVAARGQFGNPERLDHVVVRAFAKNDLVILASIDSTMIGAFDRDRMVWRTSIPFLSGKAGSSDHIGSNVGYGVEPQHTTLRRCKYR